MHYLPSPTIKLVNDNEVSRKFLSLARKSDVLSVDTETNNNDLRDGRGYCVGVSLSFWISKDSDASLSHYLPFRHQFTNLDNALIYELKEILETHPCLVFHNAKFDIVSLETLGIKIPDNYYDTMLMAHMVNENWPSKALDWLSKNILKIEGKERDETFNLVAKHLGWDMIDPMHMYNYACQDAELTLRLYEYLLPRFEAQGFKKIWQTERDFIRTIITMESFGVKIDTELCIEQIEKGEEILSRIRKRLGYTSLGPKAYEDLFFKKLHMPVVKRSIKTNQPSFDKYAMEEYDEILSRSKNPIAKTILEYRGWQKTVSSNYKPYIKLLSPDDRVRPNYKLHGTVTSRLSCELPNLQQIPRVSDKPWNGRLKDTFIPAVGYELWECDFSQLEFRLAAAYGKQYDLIEIFNDPTRDVFTEMSQQLNMSRYDTKTLTYTIQYGGGANRIKNVFGVTPLRAKAIRDNWYDTYTGIRKASSNAKRYCIEHGYVPLWTGRRRHFDIPKLEAHKAFNAVLQGGAAELVKYAMIRCFNKVHNEEECRMLLQVHDSLVFEIKEGLEDIYLPLIQSTMEDHPLKVGVQFPVKIQKWGE